MRIDGNRGSYPLAGLAAPVGPSQMYRKTTPVLAAELTEPVMITTLEGEMVAGTGDYLAQHADGHAWPVKRSVFLDTYVPAGPSSWSEDALEGLHPLPSGDDT
jgi:hypothetical protein